MGPPPLYNLCAGTRKNMFAIHKCWSLSEEQVFAKADVLGAVLCLELYHRQQQPSETNGTPCSGCMNKCRDGWNLGWHACTRWRYIRVKNNWNKNETKKIHTGWALWTVAKSQTILFPVDKSFPLGGSDLRCGRLRERGEELPTQLRWIPDLSGEVKGSRWKGLWYTFHMPCIEPLTAHCAPGSEDVEGLIPHNIITIFEVRQEISTKTYFPTAKLATLPT